MDRVAKKHLEDDLSIDEVALGRQLFHFLMLFPILEKDNGNPLVD